MVCKPEANMLSQNFDIQSVPVKTCHPYSENSWKKFHKIPLRRSSREFSCAI